MDAVGEKNPKRLRERVYPERGAGEPRVAIGAKRKNFPARTAVARINVPAQSAPRPDIFRRLHARHQPEGLRFENAHALEPAQVEQHPRVAREVGCRGEQTRVTGHTAHVARRRVMHHSPEDFAVHTFGRGNAREFRGRRQKTGVLHLQRPINFPRDKLVEFRSAHPPHDFAEQEKVDVAVTKRRAGLRQKLFRAGHANGGVVAGPGRVRADVRWQAGRVREEMANGNRLFAVAFELRNVSLRPIVEFDFPALDQQHHRRRAGDHLR